MKTKFDKSKAYPIAMRCNEEQFESIKPILKNTGISIKYLSDWNRMPYLTNNYNRNLISNILEEDINIYSDGNIHETFNADLFLDACGRVGEEVHQPQFDPLTRGGYDYKIYRFNGMDKDYPIIGEVKSDNPNIWVLVRWNLSGVRDTRVGLNDDAFDLVTYDPIKTQLRKELAEIEARAEEIRNTLKERN